MKQLLLAGVCTAGLIALSTMAPVIPIIGAYLLGCTAGGYAVLWHLEDTHTYD